jgi:hypothetical protein
MPSRGYSTPPNAPSKGFQAPAQWTIFPDKNDYANPVSSKGYETPPAVKTWSAPVAKASLYSQGYTGKSKEIDLGFGNYQSPKTRPSLYSQGYAGKKTYKPPQAKPSLVSQGVTGVKDGPWNVKKSYSPPKQTKPYDLDNLPTATKAGFYFSPKDPEKVAQAQAQRTARWELRREKRVGSGSAKNEAPAAPEEKGGELESAAVPSAATDENEAPAAPEEKGDAGPTSPALFA